MTLYVTILCGAADRPTEALGFKTPLEAARTPVMDRLARVGQQSVMHVIDETICPESDSGAMALLGYDPLKYYAGRGALEALGLGCLKAGDNAVGFRVNFASFNARTGRLDRRTSRDLEDEELQALASEVREGVRLDGFSDVSFSLHAFGRHRGVLCFQSSRVGLSGEVSNTDPGFRRVGPFGVPNERCATAPEACVPLDGSPEAAMTAALVTAFVDHANRILERSTVNERRIRDGRLPANALLVRDGGSKVHPLESFAARHGKTLSFFGQIPAEAGLCQLIGARFSSARWDGSESLSTYYARFCERVLADEADVVFAHVKEADEPGHDGRPEDKVAALERIDAEFMAPLVEGMSHEDACIVTSDHATPCDLGIHSADPVPVLVCGAGIVPDATTHFGESYARRGALPVRRAVDLMSTVLSR